VDPNAPLVIAAEDVGTSIANFAGIVRDLAAGTMAESFIQALMGKDLAAKVQAAFDKRGVSAKKRFELWLSPDDRFLDVMIPTTDPSKLRPALSKQVASWTINDDHDKNKKGQTQKKSISATSVREPVADAVNAAKSGDMFWYDPIAPHVSTTGCHYYANGYQRCTIALVGKGVAKSEFVARWKQRYAKRAVNQGFRAPLASGVQARVDLSHLDSHEDAANMLKSAIPDVGGIVDMLLGFAGDSGGREYWTSIDRSAIRYGKRSDASETAAVGLSAKHVAGMPAGSLVRFAGFVPSAKALMSLEEHAVDALDREKKNATQRAPMGILKPRSASQYSNKIDSWKSILKQATSYVQLVANRPFYGFFNVNAALKNRSDKKSDWKQSITQLIKLCLVQQIDEKASDTDIDALFQSVANTVNDSHKRSLAKRATRPSLKRKQPVDANSTFLTFKQHKGGDIQSGATAGWDLSVSLTGKKQWKLGSLWRKQNKLMYGFGDDVGDFLIKGKVSKRAGLSLASAPKSKQWVNACADAASQSAHCRELFEISNLQSIGNVVETFIDSDMVTDQVNIITKRIKKIDMGVVSEHGESIGNGQILFDFK